MLPYGIEKCVHSARCLHRIADRGASWALPPTEIMHTQCALFVQAMPSPCSSSLLLEEKVARYATDEV